VENKTKPMI